MSNIVKAAIGALLLGTVLLATGVQAVTHRPPAAPVLTRQDSTDAEKAGHAIDMAIELAAQAEGRRGR